MFGLRIGCSLERWTTRDIIIRVNWSTSACLLCIGSLAPDVTGQFVHWFDDIRLSGRDVKLFDCVRQAHIYRPYCEETLHDWSCTTVQMGL